MSWEDLCAHEPRLTPPDEPEGCEHEFRIVRTMRTEHGDYHLFRCNHCNFEYDDV